MAGPSGRVRSTRMWVAPSAAASSTGSGLSRPPSYRRQPLMRTGGPLSSGTRAAARNRSSSGPWGLSSARCSRQVASTWNSGRASSTAATSRRLSSRDDLVDDLVQGEGRPGGEHPPCPDELGRGQILEVDRRAHRGLAGQHVRAVERACRDPVHRIETLGQPQMLQRGDRARGDDAAHAASFDDQGYAVIVIRARSARAQHIDGRRLGSSGCNQRMRGPCARAGHAARNASPACRATPSGG